MQKYGFTLAEVLITLGIIGVVAALTIPTLMQQQKKIATQSAIKKFYSNWSNAIKLSEAENGPSDKWNKEEFDAEDEDVVNAKVRNAEAFFNQYMAPYLKYTTKETRDENGVPRFIVTLADGTEMMMSNGACMDYRIDVNGIKGPNEYGKDRFHFIHCINHPWGNSNYCYPSGKVSYCPYYASKTREQLLDLCAENGIYCAALLEKDNWEFKDDYPYKF